MKKKNKKFNFVFNSDVDLEGNSIKIFLKKKIFSIFTYLKKLRKNFENIERSKKIEGNKVFFKDNDNNFFLDLEKKLQRNFYIYNEFENHHSQILEAVIKPNTIVIDIGANVGILSIKFANILKKKEFNKDEKNKYEGKVISFEPSKNTFYELLFNIEINKDQKHSTIEAFNLGLGIKTEDKIFYEIKDPNMQHSHAFIKNNLFKNEEKKIIETKVKCVSLDEFFLDKYEQKISLIKIDTGGDELDIIKGSKKIIVKFNPTILFEFDRDRIKYLNISPSSYNYIFELKYKVYLILENGFLYEINSFDEAFYYPGKFFEICCMPKQISND
tara:strand:- start:436 stop:1422 length:987 start_codon:yes stop_codon:yes gene_type:complete